MFKRQIVVTGLGTVNPLGLDVRAFDDALRAGRSGLGPITKFDTAVFSTKHAYEVKNFSATKSKSSALDPFIQYILAAATEAVADSGLQWRGMDPYRIGISISSSKGGVSTIEKYGPRFRRSPSALVAALCYASLPPNIAAQWVAKKFLVRGPAISYVAACATGLTAIIEGARMIERGDVDICLAGAGDASITGLMLAGYAQMGALARDALRPFDARRSGFLLGEGAAIVVLESLEHARARGARIYGEFAGFAYGTDTYSVTHFDPKAHTLSRTLTNLFESAGISPAEVDYAHLHGTGTVEGDRYEADEIDRAFGGNKKGSAPGETAFSAIKSLTGHMLGASGAAEFISLLLSMRGSYVPPVTTCEKLDSCVAFDLVRSKAREKKIRVATAHNMGFGGRVAAVAVRCIT